MSTTYKAGKLFGKYLDGYTEPEVWTINGVTIYLNPSPDGVSADRWRSVLEAWLPEYDSVGWLEDFNTIQITEDCIDGDGVARCNLNGTIDLENDPVVPWSGDMFVNDSIAGILTHEFIHHAHLTINGADYTGRTPRNQGKLRNEVSFYAGKDVGEAVAEIGSAIVFDEPIPDWATDYYDEKGGHEGVYAL